MDTAPAYYHSPFGTFEILTSDTGIRSLRLIPEKKPTAAPVSNYLQRDCIRQLEAYFKRQLKQFDLPLDWTGAPAFHQSVWEELLLIPYGHTISYLAIAEALGDAKSVRAVGQANRNNPIPIIVPCHRVIAKNGDLHGYYYGLDMKRALLELENPMSFAEQGRLFD